MSENQKEPTVQNNANSTQNNQKKESNPPGKTTANAPENEKVKPMPAEVGKEQEDTEHPHEKSVPVGTKNETKKAL